MTLGLPGPPPASARPRNASQAYGRRPAGSLPVLRPLWRKWVGDRLRSAVGRIARWPGTIGFREHNAILLAGQRAGLGVKLSCYMRSRPSLWLLLSVMLFVSGACFWRLGGQWAAERIVFPFAQSHSRSPVAHASPVAPLSLITLLDQPGAPSSPPPEQPLTQHATRTSSPSASPTPPRLSAN